MRLLTLFLLLVFSAFACENESFDKDKRQIVAKNVIREKLRRSRSFDIVSFKEDTLASSPDTMIKNLIRYSLNFVYTDSTGTVQHRNGVVLFTPDGKSLLNSQIVDSVY